MRSDIGFDGEVAAIKIAIEKAKSTMSKEQLAVLIRGMRARMREFADYLTTELERLK